MKDLNGEGLQPKFHQLDLVDKTSCEKLKSFLQSNYGGLDILVNNAGMAYKVGCDTSQASRLGCIFEKYFSYFSTKHMLWVLKRFF